MDTTFIYPTVLREDLDQEIELLKLEGVKNPKRSLIYKRMLHKEQIFDEIPEGVIVQTLIDPTPESDPEVIERLVEFALDQEIELQTVILDFLDNPSEQSLQETLQKMSLLGFELFELPEIPKPKTLTQIISETLSKGALTLDELYGLARSLHPSKRPEAAVRTVLRKLLAQGVIYYDGSHYKIP
jgi:hypothetical protein